MQVQGNLSAILERHTPVFAEGLGKMKGLRAKIAVKPGCMPRFWKPRPVPFARKDAVENAIRKWEEMGVIKPVPYSDRAAPGHRCTNQARRNSTYLR